MFESLVLAPPDPILGITEAFLKDPNPAKINLSVGVYRDESGNTPVLRCVKRAEERLVRDETTKSYKPISGDPRFARHVLELLFGADHDVIGEGRAVAAHAPGGTGALRVAANWLRAHAPGATVWLSDPTWENHGNIFAQSGVSTAVYPYLDRAAHGLALEGMLAALGDAPRGDVVLLHACCHNPSGVDPDPEEWRAIADLIEKRGLVPFFDFAYQGFARGLEVDAAPVREFADRDIEMIISSSFSKNFGLYNERVGALTMVARTSDAAAAALSHVKAGIRANYSNPPAHGSSIVTTVLDDPELRADWEVELTEMRDRIRAMRHAFVAGLAERGVGRDFSFLERQNGMFSFSGLDAKNVARLREEYSVYIVGSGRINVAGMTTATLPALCDAIAGVLA